MVSQNPGHLQAIASRAEPFLYLITEKVEQRGLPLELVLLPIVESSFDPFAIPTAVLRAYGSLFVYRQALWSQTKFLV